MEEECDEQITSEGSYQDNDNTVEFSLEERCSLSAQTINEKCDIFLEQANLECLETERRSCFKKRKKRPSGITGTGRAIESESSIMCHSSRYSSNNCKKMTFRRKTRSNLVEISDQKSHTMYKLFINSFVIMLVLVCTYNQFELLICGTTKQSQLLPIPFSFVGASLIVGDSAIEITEVDSDNPTAQQMNNEPSVILGTSPPGQSAAKMMDSLTSSSSSSSPPLNSSPPSDQQQPRNNNNNNKYRSSSSSTMPSPLPPLAGNSVDHPNQANDPSEGKRTDLDIESRLVAGKVVDFELTPAGGHNKAKIKKKKKKKKKEESEMFKKWGKKKSEEKKAMDKHHKEGMKKKKEEGIKKKKKWGHDEHGLKKKGNFKKKKWGKKVKKGKGIKKGKKGKKFLKDKGHKHTGFKNVYHKEEYGGSKKWHDIKRVKEWDEESKKWKKKWNKEKGKKYKGEHMKKFEKKKKEGKKYEKMKKDKYKKYNKEKYEKGKKKKMEEHGKKKEGGVKKKEMEMKKKKKKKKP